MAWREGAWLQWGRDQLVAEIIQGRPVVLARLRLQWGRDQLVAEIIASMPDRRACPISLQWGRDQLVAEILP
jgi:predicted GTPase